MKRLRSQWGRVWEYSQSVLNKSGVVEGIRGVQGATHGGTSSTASRVAEYAKQNIPRPHWGGGYAQKQQNYPAWRQSSSSQNWGSFAMTGAVSLTSGGALMLLYAHRNDYAGHVNSLASLSWDVLNGAKTSLADLLPQGQGPWHPSSGNFLADAAQKASPAIVNITANFQQSGPVCWTDKTCGSGFITDSSGIIVTNAHVVDNAICKQQMTEGKTRERPLRVSLQDGQSFEAKVVGIDRQSDLALIEIASSSPLPTVKLGSSKKMRVGEWVLALGSPLTLQNSVTAGIISCTGRKAEELGLTGTMSNYIQTDAAINTGNSGGPLVDMNGEVIGVSCMRALSNGVSFAIPIDSALEILKEMKKGDGRVIRPYVGIKMLELNSEIALHMHQKNRKFPALTTGILVPFVSKGSPADKAGLKAGDIITGLAEGTSSIPLTVSSLTTAFTNGIGKKMKVHVRRESQSLLLVLTPCEATQ